MANYNTCPGCGAHLDPCEICTDCSEEQKKRENPPPQSDEPTKITDK